MNKPPSTYSAEQRAVLLHMASRSLSHAVAADQPLAVDVQAYEELLRQNRGSFVTLRLSGGLRGCMGTLKAKRPLIEDVAYNAHASATRDPRFEAVTAEELPQLELHISVLSEAEHIEFTTIEELFKCVRPGVDGLIVRSGNRSGTLLPAVWNQIPQVADFWEQLLIKAGFPAGYWDEELTVFRYTTESFGGRFVDSEKP